ncbi:MAG: helix-turn-helix domain-containing protein, partial [Alphaproteobacteria bacterium]
ALDGRLLRSSTLILKGEDKKPQAILCLNQDDGEFHRLIDHLQQITQIEDRKSSENFSTNVAHLGEQIIADIMATNHKPVHGLNAQEKKQLTKKMAAAGAFEIKGSVEIAAKMLSVSEPTLYRYLKQV